MGLTPNSVRSTLIECLTLTRDALERLIAQPIAQEPVYSRSRRALRRINNEYLPCARLPSMTLEQAASIVRWLMGIWSNLPVSDHHSMETGCDQAANEIPLLRFFVSATACAKGVTLAQRLQLVPTEYPFEEPLGLLVEDQTYDPVPMPVIGTMAARFVDGGEWTPAPFVDE
jgi:hypothetical protein